MGEYLTSREVLEGLCQLHPAEPPGPIRNCIAAMFTVLSAGTARDSEDQVFYRSGRFIDAPTQWDQTFGNPVTPLEDVTALAAQKGYVLVNGYRVATAKLETTDIGPFSPQPWIYDPATEQWSNGRHTSHVAPVGGDTLSYILTLEGTFEEHPLTAIRHDSSATREMKGLAGLAGRVLWILGKPRKGELLIRKWGDALQR